MEGDSIFWYVLLAYRHFGFYCVTAYKHNNLPTYLCSFCVHVPSGVTLRAIRLNYFTAFFVSAQNRKPKVESRKQSKRSCGFPFHLHCEKLGHFIISIELNCWILQAIYLHFRAVAYPLLTPSWVVIVNCTHSPFIQKVWFEQ